MPAKEEAKEAVAALGRDMLKLVLDCGVDDGSTGRIALCIATDAWMKADLPMCRAMSAAAAVLLEVSVHGTGGARRRLDEGNETALDLLQRASSTSGRTLRGFLEPLTGCRCFELATTQPLGLGFPPEVGCLQTR